MLKVAWSPIYNHPLPSRHRFPMIKYDLIREQLLYEGTLTDENFFLPQYATDKQIEATHCPDYLRKLKHLKLTEKEIRRTGFPLSNSLVEREIIIAGGTVQCCDYALDNGIALNIAGGTHHAYYEYGEGFCLLNDQAIGANYLINSTKAKKVLILDLDVHQGNGTATLFSSNTSVFTLSFHGAKNYPFKKEVSDLDVAFDDDINDLVYLEVLNVVLKTVIQREEPDFVFYQSGVDALSEDKLGRLGMTLDGLKERDKLVFNYCKQFGLPVVVCMGGGYSSRLSQIVDAHANTFRVAKELYE